MSQLVDAHCSRLVCLFLSSLPFFLLSLLSFLPLSSPAFFLSPSFPSFPTPTVSLSVSVSLWWSVFPLDVNNLLPILILCMQVAVFYTILWGNYLRSSLTIFSCKVVQGKESLESFKELPWIDWEVFECRLSFLIKSQWQDKNGRWLTSLQTLQMENYTSEQERDICMRSISYSIRKYLKQTEKDLGPKDWDNGKHKGELQQPL